ncbi:hypothetical protein PISL3812_08438 [Talaromyces islandicus]|uniref:t-SNARE coiled-coil homology domain-containing protein n=1 Tax=Talaromyces islandicus TaxID=28573 RepID=A0A0U1M8V5_TALIS|nr:hypothetical protein PISL3812_08438 [Talaromyces islandicus]
MTDLTPCVRELVRARAPPEKPEEKIEKTEKTVNEFLKEAYRINSHIQSLLHYLKSIRQSYLSTTAPKPGNKKQQQRTPSPAETSGGAAAFLPTGKLLTDTDRDSIDSSTALLLRDLSSSITNLQSAESLRQDTEAQLLRKKYGRPGGALWRWAGGGEEQDENEKSEEQLAAENSARTTRSVRESVLWFLRRKLEDAAEVQRGMVEKRIERVREKEKSVLYKVQQHREQKQQQHAVQEVDHQPLVDKPVYDTSAALSAADAAAIETQLSPAQLQLFAEENDTMLKQYEDALSKVQNAEKSLLEISSLQQTLVGHLSTQEEFISQLVTDASTTSQNVDRGNKELRRASERRSTAQMVFWGTVGLCTWLIVWDAIF